MSIERCYRLLLLCYPPSYRNDRGGEMLDVVMSGSQDRRASSELGEALGLVRHGLAMRFRLRRDPRQGPATMQLAGVSLVLLMAVLGAQQLMATGLRGMGSDGDPDAWGTHVVWVDPRWPVHAVWALAGVLLFSGRHRVTIISTWTAVLLETWLLAAKMSTAVPWPGALGPSWDAPVGPSEIGWLVLTLAGAVLLGSPIRMGRAWASQSHRRWTAVAVVGLAVSCPGRSRRADYAAVPRGRRRGRGQ